MQKIKKAKSAIIILVILWMLTGLSVISTAENIPISEEGLEKIGLDRMRLESGIGVVVFNLSKSQNRLIAEGYLSMSNTYNTSATIICQVITQLSSVDLDENGNPRIHKTISDTIIFKSIPDGSWIILEDDEATINPYSIYNFRYTVNIPLDEETTFNVDEGYLLYINVKKSMKNATGASIGINYNYKLFIIFTGELQEEKKEDSISGLLLMIIIPVVIFIGVMTLLYKFVIHKKASIPLDTNPSRNSPKEMGEKQTRQKIDDILERRDG